MIITTVNTNQLIQNFILSRFDIIKKLGSGAYGHVWKVLQRSTSRVFALKKIFQAFQHSTDAQRTYREVSILSKLDNFNIIKLNNVYMSRQNTRDVYLVFEYMQTDLYKGIYDDLLQNVHKKYILYQLMLGMKYLHGKGVLHRDLKPSNLLLNQKCEMKVCDFGLARVIQNQDQQKQINNNNDIMTQGVATRWYRAPEVLLGSTSYNQKADIWSIGCIMGEILLKSPLFPGSSTINQLQRMLQFVGHPQSEDISSISCEYAQKFIQQCSTFKKRSIKQYFPYYSASSSSDYSLLVDLVYRILKFNPQKRATIEEILNHGYFAEFYNDGKDLINSQNGRLRLEVDENVRLKTEEYIQLMREFDGEVVGGKQREHAKKGQLLKNVNINNNNKPEKPIIHSKSPINSYKPLNFNNKTFTPTRTRISTNPSIQTLNHIIPSQTFLILNNNHEVSPQRFRDIKKLTTGVNVHDNSKAGFKLGQMGFSKLLNSEKLKKRCDSRDSLRKQGKQTKNVMKNCQQYKQNQNYEFLNKSNKQSKQKKNCQLFSEIIKNKNSNRKNSSEKGSCILKTLKNKQNIHQNGLFARQLKENSLDKSIADKGKVGNLNNFTLNNNNKSSTTPRTSFMGLKKTANFVGFANKCNTFSNNMIK